MQDFSTHVLVVAAALIGADGRVLLQRRRIGSEHGGLWEFPGGKVEQGETPHAALVREIQEELGVALDQADLAPLTFASAAQMPAPPGRPVIILLYMVRCWRGVPECLDGEEIAWFAAQDIAGLAMPPLDYPLAAALIEAI